MQAVVKAPHINFRIKGKIPKWLLDALKKRYSEKVSISKDEDQAVNIFETDWYKKVNKAITPGFSLKTYRNNNNLTQVQLAKKIKETPQHISDMENDRRAISKKKAIKLAKLFRTSVNHFIK